MAEVVRSYEYKDVYVSLLRYLGEIAQRISTKYNIPAPTVVNLDGYPDLAKLPEGDIIFVSDWTIDVSGHQYGDTHNLMIGFGVKNDPNLMRLETQYLNELMLDVARRKPCRTAIRIFSEDSVTKQKGVFVFSDDYETLSPKIQNSMVFKACLVTLLSPQRLQAKN